MRITVTALELPQVMNCVKENFSFRLNPAKQGDLVPLASRMRRLTAQLEKVLDTIELEKDFHPKKMNKAAERMADSLHTYVEAIREDEIALDMNYSIWALIAIRRWHEMQSTDELKYIEDFLSQAILT